MQQIILVNSPLFYTEWLDVMKSAKSRGIPIIICECGAQIMLSHNLQETESSIENHIENHKKRETDPEKARKEAERIEDLLIKKIVAAVYAHIS
jgi:hypothetical protein